MCLPHFERLPAPKGAKWLGAAAQKEEVAQAEAQDVEAPESDPSQPRRRPLRRTRRGTRAGIRKAAKILAQKEAGSAACVPEGAEDAIFGASIDKGALSPAESESDLSGCLGARSRKSSIPSTAESWSPRADLMDFGSPATFGSGSVGMHSRKSSLPSYASPRCGDLLELGSPATFRLGRSSGDGRSRRDILSSGTSSVPSTDESVAFRHRSMVHGAAAVAQDGVWGACSGRSSSSSRSSSCSSRASCLSDVPSTDESVIFCGATVTTGMWGLSQAAPPAFAAGRRQALGVSAR